ncbi:histidinol dehydrogenase [Desulfovibrio ferrophilus]|uniref:Histidinol dehydrogenase n=1 Tax=Desulfovibrio ferrophilus TaxID=241368 RepID=A0A2Z6AY97_9BACT|nr:histidinol dehydrogenase [Desulfovibrio ferrophilus]BBD08244.1 histidinol dehydrogenase [Desulfovibrio ferrophilus]
MPCPELPYSGPQDWATLQNRLAGRDAPGANVDATVTDILNDVRERGDQALVDYGRKFDCKTLTTDTLKVSPQEFEAAMAEIPAADMEILAEAAANIRDYHERQRENSWWTTKDDGTILGQMVTPVDRVGLYVPGGQGGQVPLISSLLMNAIPAQVAGVREIQLTTPPRPDGSLNPYLLATAKLLGLSELFRAGSAWAIAALAYGTASVKAVDVIAGPGNIFVTTAKRLLMGKVGIDMIAGPSEIAIIADESANPAWLAADMLSQAEHDPLASSILATTDPKLAQAVRAELEQQTVELPRAEVARKSLSDWGAILLCPDLDAAVDCINRLAPEHLELAVADPWALLGKIRHAGAIFMGHTAPEPVGDYFAGPNHVLPTLSTARFSSALSVQTFVKKSSVVATSPAFVQAHADKIARLARLEGLEAHARSVEKRKS